jgi:hypothetical protein
MKKYRIREGSPAETLLGILVLTMLIVISGLGNHFIDGIY